MQWAVMCCRKGGVPMAKKNFYAVKIGKTPGIYRSWEECRVQVEGVPGAKYKGFATEGEAYQYMGEGAKNEGITAVEKKTSAISGDVPELMEGEALAYVDGSYNADTGEYSGGVVFFYEGEQFNLSRRGEDEEMAQMRNVAGEILGARIAMEEAQKRGATHLTIVHDYQGIASWCMGEWKTNKEGTKAYKAYFDSLKERLLISFRKVRGHSGDVYNELADELAKRAIFPPALPASSPDRKNTSDS